MLDLLKRLQLYPKLLAGLRSGLLMLGTVAIVLASLALPAQAGKPEASLGAQVFEAYCVGCHIKGGNVVRRGKNLKLQTLKRNHLDTEAAIAQLVRQGKGIMSAYADRLTAPQIQAVAHYVLDRATENWR